MSRIESSEMHPIHWIQQIAYVALQTAQDRFKNADTYRPKTGLESVNGVHF